MQVVTTDIPFAWAAISSFGTEQKCPRRPLQVFLLAGQSNMGGTYDFNAQGRIKTNVRALGGGNEETTI